MNSKRIDKTYNELGWFYRPQFAFSAALFRIATGIVLLLTVSLFGAYIKEFFSNEGYVTSNIVRGIKASGGGGNGFSLFFYNDDYWFVAVSYMILIVSGIAFTFGIYSRVFAFVSYLLYMSFYNRFPLIGFGGSEILIMTLFFASFLRTDRKLIPSWYRKFRGFSVRTDWVPGWPARLIQINLAIIYLFAGITKLTHEPWLNAYELPGLLGSYYGTVNGSELANYPWLVGFLTYSSMVIEAGFPFLIWLPQARPWILSAIILMHVGIAVTINVTYFSEVMIACLLIFVHPRDILFLQAVKEFVKKVIMRKLSSKKIIYSLIGGILLFGAWCIVGIPLLWQLGNQGCPRGYVWVNGNDQFGTAPGFCVMKYEAKRDNHNAISIPQTPPWVNIDRNEAQAACQANGAEYDLISDKEWLTIAYDIANTPINDIYSAQGLQLAVGNVNGLGKSLAAKPIDDPYTWGCDINQPLYEPSNEYKPYRCEVRGRKSLFYEKGFSGTQSSFDKIVPLYDAGKTADRSRSRTLILSNGAAIWDFSGNVWEWVTSPLVREPLTGVATQVGEDTDGITDQMPLPKQNPQKTFFHFYDDITDWKEVSYLKPLNNLHCSNGIGKIYLDPGESWGAVDEETRQHKAFIRGGAWGNPTEAGILSLNISHATSDRAPYIGFRCVKRSQK